jgi:DNA-binding GntR family transcriptional regulator
MAVEKQGDSGPGRPHKGSLKEEVYEGIRQEIMDGTFLPGDLLKERELAEKYGVSKTPVREALSMLEQDNLVKTIPRAGYMVTQLTLRDLQEVYQLRVILEPMAARLAAQNLTDEDLKQLEALTVTSDPEEARLFNRRFHVLIANASGNSRLARMIGELLDDMDRWAALDLESYRPEVLLIGHEAELEALRTRDPQVTEETMRHHIRAVYQHLAGQFQ